MNYSVYGLEIKSFNYKTKQIAKEFNSTGLPVYVKNYIRLLNMVYVGNNVSYLKPKFKG